MLQSILKRHVHLALTVLFALVLASCSDDDNPVDPNPWPDTSSEYSDIEKEIFDLVNDYRAENGLPTFSVDAAIIVQCRSHSRDMGKGIVPFGHDGFDARIDEIRKSMNVRGGAENVYFRSSESGVASATVNAWKNSDGHNKNMLGDYNVAGVGVEVNSNGNVYVTMIHIKN